MKKYSANGFTLIELLVVVLMAGILASIAAPGWLTFIARERMNKVQDEILQVLQSAQSDAQRTNRRYTLDIGTTVGAAILTTTPGTVSVLGDEQIRSKLKLDATDGTGVSVDELVFDEKGQIEVIGTLPLVLQVSIDGATTTSRCIVVTTLLGNMVTAKNEDCTNPVYVP